MTHFVTSVLSEGLPEKYVHFALLLNTFIISMTHCRLLLPVCLAETTNYRVDEIIPSNVMQNYFTEKKERPTGMFTVKRIKNNITWKNFLKLGWILCAK